MTKKVLTVAGMVLFVLDENVDGLEFKTLLSRCNFTGHQDAFEMNLRNLLKQGKIFAWNGKFHHNKYRDEKVRAKKIEADLRAKDATTALKKVRREVKRNLDKKLDAIDKLVDITGGDIAATLKSIKQNLESVANAGL